MMTEDKIIPLKKKQQQQDFDSNLIDKINKGLNQLDNTYQTYTPNVQWFEQMVIKEKEAARRRLVKELIIFFISAITILSLLVLTIFKAPVIFIVLQVIVTISLPLGVYIHHRKQVIIHDS
ncbi:YxlC family protein [Cytobacillus luteolus]|nr:YxlC family protein [Cytobacillus luteolus]